MEPAVVGYGLASVKNQKLSSYPSAIILSSWLSRKQGVYWDMCAVVKECRWREISGMGFEIFCLKNRATRITAHDSTLGGFNV